MSPAFVAEQLLNGIQLSMMLFLLAAGLTLVFGVMDLINLAHGSLYMIGAFAAASVVQAGGGFFVAVLVAALATAAIAVLIETTLLRRIYGRDHLAQVLTTFALVLITNDLVRLLFGNQALNLNLPPALFGPVLLPGGVPYSAYRLVIIAVGLVLAVMLWLVLGKTRLGMRIRAGASNRAMATVMGADIRLLYTLVFAAGGALSAIAGALLAPLLAVQVGMGENILIYCFVVVVIGGIGSVRGAFFGALLVGTVDTLGRSTLPALIGPSGTAVAAMLIYVAMAVVLVWRPRGLFGVT